MYHPCTGSNLLGEVDRARAVLQYGSQFADPRRDVAYWQRWRSFEEAHGNEDTFRDMLRVQRSVETAFAHVSNGGNSFCGPLVTSNICVRVDLHFSICLL